MLESLVARRALGMTANDAACMLGRLPAVRATEQPLDAASWLQFDPADPAPRAALDAATGIVLDRADRAVQHAGRTALWLGPGNWLLATDADRAGDPEPLRVTLDHGLEGVACAITDVSDLWFRVRVEGTHGRNVLAKGCALDFHPEVFPPGASAVAQFARIRALIHHLDRSSGYHVYTERSFARYLWTWLADAMAEYLD